SGCTGEVVELARSGARLRCEIAAPVSIPLCILRLLAVARISWRRDQEVRHVVQVFAAGDHGLGLEPEHPRQKAEAESGLDSAAAGRQVEHRKPALVVVDGGQELLDILGAALYGSADKIRAAVFGAR